MALPYNMKTNMSYTVESTKARTNIPEKRKKQKKKPKGNHQQQAADSGIDINTQRSEEERRADT